MPVVKKHLTYPSAFVAAGNASARDKSRADYVCDGVGDQVEIQAALDTYGSVILSKGEFSVSSPVILQTDNSIVGQGTATTVRAANGLNNHVFTTTASGNVFFVKLENFRIDGNRANQTATSHGVYVRRGHTWLLNNLHIKDARNNAIKVEGTGSAIALNNRIVNCRLENSGQQCLFIADFAPNNHFVGNIIGGNSDFYLIECGNDENIFVDCHLHTGASHGAYVNGKNNIFQGVIAESCSGHGFYFIGEGNSAIGCVSFNHTQNGFHISGDYNRVIGCRAFDRQGTKTQDYGLALASGAEYNLIAHNNFLASDHTTGSIQDASGNTTNTFIGNYDYNLSVHQGRLDVRGQFRTPPVALTDAPTISVNAALGNFFTVTLGGNRTLANPTNPIDGQRIVFRIRQDATGGRTLTLGSKFRFGTDISGITLSTAANKTDFLTVVYHEADDRFDVVSFVRGY